MKAVFDKETMMKAFNKPEEKFLFARVLDQALFSLESGQTEYSDFLDEYHASAFAHLLKTGITVSSFGGYDEAERKILALGNFFDFPITAIAISFQAKFSNLTHRDFLGSIIGLGINRALIGDILIKDDRALIFAKKEIADYITANLTKVKNASVRASDAHLSAADEFIKLPVSRNITSASLRLDAVASAAFNLSRGNVAELIGKGRGFINWTPVSSASKNVQTGDTVTLRGVGRFRIVEITGQTKKGNFKLLII